MNNGFGISDKSFELLIQTLRKFPQVDRSVIFGSRAKGNYKQGSDIDLAIFGINCTPKVAMDIQGYLNMEVPMPYFVDIVDYKSLDNSDLKNHIDRVGKVFYDNDPEA